MNTQNGSNLQCFESEPDVAVVLEVDVVEHEVHGSVLKGQADQLKQGREDESCWNIIIQVYR